MIEHLRFASKRYWLMRACAKQRRGMRAGTGPVTLWWPRRVHWAPLKGRAATLGMRDRQHRKQEEAKTMDIGSFGGMKVPQCRRRQWTRRWNQASVGTFWRGLYTDGLLLHNTLFCESFVVANARSRFLGCKAQPPNTPNRGCVNEWGPTPRLSPILSEQCALRIWNRLTWGVPPNTRSFLGHI